MHRLLPVETPSRWWSPRLSPAWVRLWRPLRKMLERRVEKICEIEIRGLEHVREAVARGDGVLITPNHFTYADPYLLADAADRVGRPFSFMAAWQVFGSAGWFKRMVLRRHGCFSVDREGTDLRAFRQAVEILQSRPHPLVVFPEGEMYHLGERVTPFREGPAAVALTAARRSDRPIVCIPCGLKYRYLEDPTPQLLQLMDRVERALFRRPTVDLPLARRVYRVAEGALALKELEYLGSTCSGPLPQRIGRLSDHVLRGLEARHGLLSDGDVPDRVRALRQKCRKLLEAPNGDAPQRRQLLDDLDDVFFVVQLFCYPGDYVAERPSVDRIGETLDKFEEDILNVPIAKPRGRRAAVLAFGEPVPVPSDAGAKEAAAPLTRTLEKCVQSLLDGISFPPGYRSESP